MQNSVSFSNVHSGQTRLSENTPKFKQLKLHENLGIVGYTFNPSTLEADTDDSK